MNKKIISILFLLLLTLGALYGYQLMKTDYKNYWVLGTGNAGMIEVFDASKENNEIMKTISSNYKYVHTVRVGDIYSDNTPYIIAGVSNSFFAEPYGCNVTAYNIQTGEEYLIDRVGDLRCKDLTIADVDKDGKQDIVLGTHGEGFINIYEWSGDMWVKETIERNYIKKIDEKEKTNHRVPQEKLTCGNCIVQTAVHIVKVVDIEGDGYNEIIATLSSPLELTTTDEVSFILLFRQSGEGWTSEVIDQASNIEFRSIEFADIYNNSKNVLVVGTGSPRNEKGSVFSYELVDGTWNKKVLYNDPEEKNMKGITVADLYKNGKNIIVIGTGFPKAHIFTLEWNGATFERKNIASIGSLFDGAGEFNTMATIVLNRRDPTIITAGMRVFPDEKIGWEATEKGFVVEHVYKDGAWKQKIISTKSVLGMDIQNN
ncbi:MAG: hypothetical protein NUV98_04195 [Candidatus Roizmanbacteria bacterium]|nr:hypothetical protein [Candidatus Roizmanbacteria bacterium]